MERQLALERQGEEAPRALELGVDQRLRHPVVRDVEEPGLAAGLVDFPGDLLAIVEPRGEAPCQVDDRNGLGRTGRRVDDHRGALLGAISRRRARRLNASTPRVKY